MMASSEGRERRYELRVCKAHGRRGCPYPECAERHCETSVEVVAVCALEAVEAERDELRPIVAHVAGLVAPEVGHQYGEVHRQLIYDARAALEALGGCRDLPAGEGEPGQSAPEIEQLQSRLRVAVEALEKLRVATTHKARHELRADINKILVSLSDRDEP